MAINATATITGNLTRDPELKFTKGGMPVCTFSVAWNNRRKGPDGTTIDETSFFDVVAKFRLAENIAETLTKGDRAIITGHFEQRSWTTPEGDRRSRIELIADNAGPDLNWATATITKNERTTPPATNNHPPIDSYERGATQNTAEPGDFNIGDYDYRNF